MPKRSEVVKRSNVSKRQTLCVKFISASDTELKALGENLPDGYVAGWASTPDMDVARHVVMAGAFAESIANRGLSGPRGIKLLIDHNWSKVAGVIRKLEYRGDRLWIEAQLNLSISYARDTYEAAKMNDGLSFSVGFDLLTYQIKGAEGGEWLQIDSGDLLEVSIVPFPANESAEMTFIKGRIPEFSTISEFEKFLVSSGLAKTRNEAHRITQVVKSAGTLFLKGTREEPASSPSHQSPAPVKALNKAKVDALINMMADARKLIEAQ